MRTALLIALLLTSPGFALELGKSPGPVALTALEGHPRVMDNYAEHRCTLVVFLSSRDAMSSLVLDDLNEISRLDAETEDLLIVGICSNPAESPAYLKTFLQRGGVVFPVYMDPEGKAARQFGATVRPECFLLDKKGKLIFHGSVDGASEAVQDTMAGRRVRKTSDALEGTPLSEPGTEHMIADPFPPIFFTSETIFESIPGAPVHHCSTLAEAANGDLVCTWYGGTYESAEDQQLFIARLPKGARTWNAPEVLIHNPDQPPGNAIIFRGPQDKLYLIWSRMEGSRPTRRGTGWTKCRLLQRTSADNGLTWSADTELPDSLGWLPRNPPLWIKGKLYLPVSAHRDGIDGGMLLRLEDDGTTWTPQGMLERAEQLTIAPRADGSLLGLMRSRPVILASESKDDGVTWAKATDTKLRCPDSSTCLLRLNSGLFILAHNDNDGWDRATLAIEQSDDEGRTWNRQRVLEFERDTENGEYSYPSLLQTGDGLIHITYTCRRYTIKHAAFNEAWLTQLVRPN